MNELWNKIDYCRTEFYMRNCEMIGIIEMVKSDLLKEIQIATQLEEDDDNGISENNIN